MRVLLIGFNHRTAPIQLRERFAMAGDTPALLDIFRTRFPDSECVIVSTCNRFELYVARPLHGTPKTDGLRAFLCEHFGLTLDQVTSSSIHREQEQAITHLFRVCCGLDSMVLGESQVLGQVKRAYESASNCGAAGPVLHKLFQQAIATAKQARTATGIGTGRVSVGSVAVDLASRVFADFSDKTVLGIGAGEVTKLTLRHMVDLKPRHLWLVNRTAQRAEELAQKFKLAHPVGGVRPWEQLDELLTEADIIVTSTAAPEPILTLDRLKPILKRRRFRPLFVIDLAVPRDADPAIGLMTNLYLYNIDDLQTIVAQSLGQRGDEVLACECHINQAVAACLSEITHADLGKLIRKLRTKLHDIGQDEQQRTLKKLANRDAPETVDEALDEYTHRLINKILHVPLSQLNQHGSDAPLSSYAAAIRRLFDLSDDDPEPQDDQTAPPPPASEQTANPHGE
jgi:glutamyl-tRNA reductase